MNRLAHIKPLFTIWKSNCAAHGDLLSGVLFSISVKSDFLIIFWFSLDAWMDLMLSDFLSRWPKRITILLLL